MFDTLEQIRNQLLAGEDGRAEFKEVRFGDRGVLSPNTEELAGELVAFANAEGGVVFLGVDDSGAARGIPLERLDAVELWLLNVATHNCDPPIRPVVRKAILPSDAEGDDRILLVEVHRGLYVHRTSGGRYYTRVGVHQAGSPPPPELARLFQQRGREYVFDEQPVPAAAVDALNRNRLEAFFGRSPTIPWLDLLRNTRVTFRDDDGVDRPTVAGLLVFATEPTEFLASGSIEAACYSGTRLSSDDLVHAERLGGPVPDQIDAGIAFVARFMQPSPTRGSSTETVPAHDLNVVDEAIVNAVDHRDYAIAGSKIRLFLFADRLELYSPGKPPKHHHPRRHALLSASPAISYWSVSCRGSAASEPGRCSWSRAAKACGRILEDGEAHSGRRPEYELFGDELRLTLWAKLVPLVA